MSPTSFFSTCEMQRQQRILYLYPAQRWLNLMKSNTQTLIKSEHSLTDAVWADLGPGALVGLSRGLRSLPENSGVSGPAGNATATQVEAAFSQTEWHKEINKNQPTWSEPHFEVLYHRYFKKVTFRDK